MNNDELLDVLCQIKPNYQTAICGDLCCIREVYDQQATIDIIERSGFRRCNVPLECIEIPEDPRTISEVCTEISRCMIRYLSVEHPEFLQTDEAQLMKQFLSKWMEH